MNIIRETHHGSCDRSRCVIRTNTYASSVAYIEKLVAVAREDFPSLTSDEIEVVKFGGERYRRTIGIEFSVQTCSVPEKYESIHSLEFQL